MSETLSEPLWLVDAQFQDFQAKGGTIPKRAEVTVIGGGITGLCCAYWLSKAGVKDIVILEKSGMSSGATGRNGGIWWPFASLPEPEDLEKYGQEEIQRISRFDFESTKLLAEIITEHNIACEFKNTGTVSLFEEENVEGTREYLESLNQSSYNIGKLEFWEESECVASCHTQSFKAGLFQPYAGQLWAAKFVFGLAEVVLKQGVHFFSHTAVNSVTRTPENMIVNTSRGDVASKRVIYATNGYTSTLLPHLKGIIRPEYGQVICTEPVSGSPWDYVMGLGEYEDYMIQRPDGRIVFGGSKSQRDEACNEKYIENGKTLDPDREIRIEREWTGLQGWTPDKRPVIGPLNVKDAADDKEFIIAGFCGEGMAKAAGASKYLVEMILGQISVEQYLKPFLFSRFLENHGEKKDKDDFDTI